MHSARTAMTNDLSTEIKITASADGVEAGVGRAKRSIADLAQAAATAGEQGGKSMQKIGAGGEAAARTMDGVTKNMVSSLQRQIAALESGGTATRQYQESIARLRGANLDTLKPYLDQLDAARVKAEAAAHSQAGLTSRLGALGGVADVVRGQILALGGSLTMGAMFAFVKRINDGVDALNDIKDATGSTIENISALEDTALRTGASLDLVGSVLIKFNDVLSKATPGSDTALALESIGLKAEELRRLDPAEALRQTAVALSGFADDANKARLIQDLFGKSVKDAAPFLADLAEKGALVGTVLASQADEADRFNKQLFEMQAHATNAARAVAGPLVAGINEAVKAFRDGSAAGEGFWETAWKRYQQNVYRLHGMPEPQGEAITSNPVGGGRGVVNPAFVDPRPSVAPHASAASLAAANTQAKQAAEALRRELAEQAKIMAELHGLSGGFADDWARLSRMYADGALSLDQLTQAQAELLAKQPAIRAAQEAEKRVLADMAKATLEAAKAREGYIASLQAGADKLLADVQAQQEAADRMGLSRQAVAELDAAKLEMLATDRELQASKELDRNLDLQAYEALMAQAKAYRELANAKRTGAARETAVEEAKKAADEWQRTSDQINQSLTDALMRGFESGKDFAQNMRDTIVNMFKTMVLRPVVSAIVSPISGALLGGLGLAGSASASQGQGINGVSTAISGASLLGRLGAFGGGMSAGFGGLMGSLGLSATGSTLGGAISAGGIALGSGNILGGLGTLAGALGPIALGIGLISSLFSRKLKDQGIEGTLGGEAGFDGFAYRFYKGGLFRSDKTVRSELDPKLDSGLDAAVRQMQQSMLGLANSFGLPTEAITGFTQSIKLSFNGLDEAGIQAKIQEALTGYNEALAGAFIESMENSEVPAWVDRLIGNTDASAVQRLQDVAEWPARLLQSFGTSRDDLVRMFTEGLASGDAQAAGEAVANQLVESIHASLMSNAAAQIFDIVNQGIVTPMLDALITGQAVSGAVSDAAIQATVDKAVAAAQALGQIFEDPAFQAAMESLRTSMASALATAGQVLQTSQSSMGRVSSIVERITSSITSSASVDAAAAVDSALANLRRAISAERDLISTQLDASSSLRDEIKNVFDLLEQSVRSLRDEAVGVEQTAAQGQAYISAALSGARATGSMPDADELSHAIAAARAGLSVDQYSSIAEQRFAQLKLAAELDALKEISGEQLTEAEYQIKLAEDQLKALDDTLNYWEQQVEAARGGVTATLSVESAVTAMQLALQKSLEDGFGSISGLGSGDLEKQLAEVASQYSPGTSADAVKQLAKSVNAGDIGLNDAVHYLAGTPVKSRLFTEQVEVFKNFDAAGYYADLRKNMDELIGQGYTAQAMADLMISMGVSLTDAANAYGITAAEVAANLLRNGATRLPQLAVGTNYLPEDMVIQAHQGERVIPAADNAELMRRLSSPDNSEALTRALIAEVRALRAQNAGLEKRLESIESHTRRTTETLDSVTEGGNAMRQIAA